MFNKKMTVCVLSGVCMMAPMTLPAYAQEITGTTEATTGTVDVKYDVDQSYTWIMHDTVDFGKDAGTNQHVDKEQNLISVTENIIEEGKELQITEVGSGNSGAFTIDNGKNEVLNYHVSNEKGEINPNGEVLAVPAGTNTASTSLKYTLDTTTKAAEKAGHYTGTATFTASIVDQK